MATLLMKMERSFHFILSRGTAKMKITTIWISLEMMMTSKKMRKSKKMRSHK